MCENELISIKEFHPFTKFMECNDKLKREQVNFLSVKMKQMNGQGDYFRIRLNLNPLWHFRWHHMIQVYHSNRLEHHAG